MEDRQSRLPEYVGKKIVEALKQDKDDIQVLEADDNVQIFNDTSEDLKFCRDTIKEFVYRWISDVKVGQIVKDDIRKLAEIFPKAPQQNKEDDLN